MTENEPAQELELPEASFDEEESPPPALELPAGEAAPPSTRSSLLRRVMGLAYYGALLASVAVLALVAVATVPTLFGLHTYVTGGGAAVSTGTAEQALFTVPLAGYVLDLSSGWLVRLLLVGIPVCLIAIGYAQALLRLLPDREARERAEEEAASAAAARLQARKAQLRLVERPEQLPEDELPVFLTGQLRGRPSTELQTVDPADIDELRAA